MTGLRGVDIVKRYGGVPALAGVSIGVEPGQVVGLVGHNGAGKSTLLRILSGAERADTGSLEIDGAAVSFNEPADALLHGIATVHQELALLPNLSVTQNVFLGREERRRGMLAANSMRRHAHDLVQGFGLEVDVDQPLGSYAVATRQLLEIAVATDRDARYLLLDEPTTSLTGAQIERLLELVDVLTSERDLGIMFVNHKLDELYAVADRIVALVDGEVRIDAGVAETSRAQVVTAIAGRPVVEQGHGLAEQDADPPHDPTALIVDDFTTEPSPAEGSDVAVIISHLWTDDLHDVSMQIRSGRVLGLYGLVGSGRTELLRTLVGLDRVRAGTITIFGHDVIPKDPLDAQRLGIAYLTEERKLDGIVPALDAVTNLTLPVLHRYSRLGVLDRASIDRDANALLDQLKLRGDRRRPIEQLSGGNQQKVLLARVLAQEARVLLLDEPTKGVDIGVKEEIHLIIRELVEAKGLAVVVASSEEGEVLAVADDVLVFHAGRCDGTAIPASSLSSADLRQAAWSSATTTDEPSIGRVGLVHPVED